jgi:hypothetical protein
LLVVDGKDGEMKIKMGSLPDKNKVTVK